MLIRKQKKSLHTNVIQISGNVLALANNIYHEPLPVHVTQRGRRARVLVAMERMVHALSGQTT